MFEINCAEDLENFKLADDLDQKLIKFASQEHLKIKKILEKALGRDAVEYSYSGRKFTIRLSSASSVKIKNKIREFAKPYNVSFRYD